MRKKKKKNKRRGKKERIKIIKNQLKPNEPTRELTTVHNVKRPNPVSTRYILIQKILFKFNIPKELITLIDEFSKPYYNIGDRMVITDKNRGIYVFNKDELWVSC